MEEYWSGVMGLEMLGEGVELVEIVHSGSHDDILKLVAIIVRTAVQAKQQHLVERMVATSKATQQFLF